MYPPRSNDDSGCSMTTITTRDIDPEIIRRLKERARNNGRSMEAEVRQILADAVRDRRAALTRIESIKASGVRPTSAEDVDGWIRGTRDRAE